MTDGATVYTVRYSTVQSLIIRSVNFVFVLIKYSSTLDAKQNRYYNFKMSVHPGKKETMVYRYSNILYFLHLRKVFPLPQ